MGDDAKSVWSQGYAVGCVNIIARTTVSWGLLNLPYDVLSIFCVALGVHEPQNWPDVFGDWSDSYTIRRFWSYVVRLLRYQSLLLSPCAVEHGISGSVVYVICTRYHII